jgi:hypothetical protein
MIDCLLALTTYRTFHSESVGDLLENVDRVLRTAGKALDVYTVYDLPCASEVRTELEVPLWKVLASSSLGTSALSNGTIRVYGPSSKGFEESWNISYRDQAAAQVEWMLTTVGRSSDRQWDAFVQVAREVTTIDVITVCGARLDRAIGRKMGFGKYERFGKPEALRLDDDQFKYKK